MGLDISAFSNMSLLGAHMNEDGEPVDNATGEVLDDACWVYVNPDFPERAVGLKDRGIYEFEDEYGFRAGSYSGYGQWRNQLACLAGYRHGSESAWATDSGPFWELINFSDCEGCIGSQVSAKLLRDFDEFAEEAQERWAPAPYILDTYRNFHKAFKLAANGGMVKFH